MKHVRVFYLILIFAITSCKSDNPLVDDTSAPVITSLNPSSGSAGDVISISGDHFTGIDSTKVNFVSSPTGVSPDISAKIISITKQIIKVQVPANLVRDTTYIQVKRGKYSAAITNAAQFRVNDLSSPSITNLEPSSGVPGDIITINGDHFTGADATTVNFVSSPAGVSPDVNAKIISLTKKIIKVQVPVNLVLDTVYIQVKRGEYRSATTNAAMFRVNDLSSPSVTSLEPSSGTSGDIITINGDHFTGVDLTTVNFVSLPAGVSPDVNAKIISLTKKIMKVQVPASLAHDTVYIQVKRSTYSSAITKAAQFRLDDLSSPSITSMDPSSGTSGDIITIHGDHFTGADPTTVFLNTFLSMGAAPEQQAEIISITKQTIKVKVPDAQMYYKGYVQVRRGKYRTDFTSPALFTFISPYWDVLTGVNIGNKGSAFSIGNTGYFLDPWGSFYALNTTTNTFSSLTKLAHSDLLRFVFGTDTKGIAVLDGSPVYEVWEYDPVLDKWTQKSNCPYHLYYGSFSFRIGSKVYIGGGSKHEFVSYDGATDTWTKLADYPGINGEGASAAAVNGIGYCFQGGWNFYQEATTYVSAFNSNGCWKYDPATNKWTSIAEIPDNVHDRSWGMAVPVGDKIYFGAEYSQWYSNTNTLAFMYEYSTTTNTWKQSLLWPYQAIGAGYGFYIGDKAYFVTQQGGTTFLVFKPNKD